MNMFHDPVPFLPIPLPSCQPIEVSIRMPKPSRSTPWYSLLLLETFAIFNDNDEPSISVGATLSRQGRGWRPLATVLTFASR